MDADLNASRWRRLFEGLLVCCAVLVIIMTWSGLLLIDAGTVLPVTWLAVAASVAVLLMRRRGPDRRSMERRIYVLLSTLVLVSSLCMSGWAALTGTTYRLLPHGSAGGCRVVVREDSFLMAGGGSIYVLRGTTGIARRVMSYETDDGDRPFTFGTGEVDWDGEVGSVSGEPGTFSC